MFLFRMAVGLFCYFSAVKGVEPGTLQLGDEVRFKNSEVEGKLGLANIRLLSKGSITMPKVGICWAKLAFCFCLLSAKRFNKNS